MDPRRTPRSRYGEQQRDSYTWSELHEDDTTELRPDDQEAARSSIGGALDVAADLTRRAGDALTDAAQQSFLSGLHVAVLAAAGLAIVSAVIVYRYLPHTLAAEGSLRHRSRVL